jgi:hypothetical protein
MLSTGSSAYSDFNSPSSIPSYYLQMSCEILSFIPGRILEYRSKPTVEAITAVILEPNLAPR